MDQPVPQQPETSTEVQLDEVSQRKIEKLKEKATTLETQMKELEEEINHLTQLGQKKSQLATVREQSAQLREEINQLKEAKKKPAKEETIEEEPVAEPMTLKGHKPGDAKDTPDPIDAGKEKKELAESGWQAYLKKNGTNKITGVEPDKFKVSMG